MPDLPPELRLLASLQRAWRHERAHVSALLHDDIGQTLTAAGLELDLLTLDYAAKVPGLAERVAAIQKTLEQAFATVRSLSHEVHPNPVERFGLPRALERLAERQRRHATAEIAVELDYSIELGGPAAEALYNCAAEVLSNALQHAQATRVELVLQREPDGVAVQITDNGAGFITGGVVPGVGFITIEYYKSLGMVYLRLETNENHGTSVTLISPNRNS